MFDAEGFAVAEDCDELARRLYFLVLEHHMMRIHERWVPYAWGMLALMAFLGYFVAHMTQVRVQEGGHERVL